MPRKDDNAVTKLAKCIFVATMGIVNEKNETEIKEMKLRTKILVSLFLSLCMVAAAGCARTGEEPTTNTGADAEPVSDGTQLVFHLDELPSIGGYYSGETVRYFYEDGPHNELEARGDYGGLVPYIAAYKPFYEPEYYTYVDSETGETVTEERDWADAGRDKIVYGMMTEDGRIVTGGLWSEVSVLTGPDGEVAYLLGQVSDSSALEHGYSADMLYCLSAFDGSWVLDLRDEPNCWVSVMEDYPYFEVQAGGELRLYDMDGKLKTELRFDQPGDAQRNIYYYVMFADEAGVTVSKDVSDENHSYREIVTFDWNGDPLYSFRTEDYPSVLGKNLLQVSGVDDEGKIVLDRSGRRLDEQAYTDIYYGEAEHLFLTFTEQDGKNTVAYFDESWKPVEPQKAAWTKKTLENAEYYNMHSIGNKTLLHNYSVDVIMDFYGNPISLPVSESDILEKDFCLVYSDNYKTETTYLRINTSDAVLICGADGALLRRIEPLPGLSATETWDAFQSIQNDAVLFLSGQDAYAYSIFTDDVLHCQTDDPQTIFDAYPQAESMNSYVADFNDNMILIWHNLSGSEDNDFYESICNAYGVTEDDPTIRNVQTYRLINGYCLMAADNSLLMLSPDGTVLLKMRNDLTV